MKFKRFGYRRSLAILRREGEVINHKRVHRVWKLSGLCLPKRAVRKRRAGNGIVPCQASFINHVWTYDFLFDSLADGRKLKILTIVDEFSRFCLRIEVGVSITSASIINILEELFKESGIPKFLRSDNGPEFIAKALRRWLSAKGSETIYIDPGSPWQNAYGESFNGKLRDECLNMNIFYTRSDAKFIIENYRHSYNYERPHSSLGYLTPAEFKAGVPIQMLVDPNARKMGLSLWATPDGQKPERQSDPLCPSVCCPATALESLPSVALSSGQASTTISEVKMSLQKCKK